MLGDGKPIDLLRLYLSVREKGGYESVSRNGYWDLVAEDIGCDSNASASLKVVYVKYLDLLDEWFAKNVEDNNSGNGSSCFNDLMLDSSRSTKLFLDVEMKDYKEFVGTCVERGLDVKDLQSCVGFVGGKDCSEGAKKSDSSGRDSVVIESVVGTNEEENESSRKRKRERYLPLLDWVKRVSKDPCDPAIGSMPERSKWKVYGGEHVWKQVLSAREAMLLKSNVDSKKIIIWQKNLRMVPAMYDDQREKSTSRCSQRLISARETQSTVPSRKPQPQDCSESSSNSPSDREDEDYFWGCNFKRKRTPLGRCFQAKVPEWTEQTYEPDTKWLGTPVWPLEKTETRSSLIELERVGKGRQDSCGCQFSGSLECIRFHVSEKRNRAKLELGSAFAKWKFDDMGENVALKWAPSEEKKFEDIIKSTPASSGTSFWDELSSHFKNKTMAVMVSYYFNVYLLRRRAHQNRSDPNNIDSDDDELEKVGNEASNNNATGSILCSPKKVQRNAR
ncbi:AT-rich interactive domain-containing protein 1-like isoform X2 [Cynara cardunculus var. scolymus]|nr:AT-rich interactive domain-containing protein 1-like isoform X2 [Cynara cardunculus var. scolymus]XP_024996848.1 AT-rich interactive domain-containing protein 1-like isoform X2 [Cynara cardunculus var. scolymus]XP_024996849.1 AT-rich interactive domain-containing protein 1-like isoform X2 [Cynara cardunculus var. scolymus]